jgi:hypothetical protein
MTAFDAPVVDSVRCGTSATTVITQTPPRTGSVSFSAGERLEYRVSFGKMHVGSGSMALWGPDTVRGQHAWRASFTIAGGLWPVKVRDSLTSWFDSLTFTSLRFARNQREPGYKADKLFEIFPDRRTYKQNSDPEQPSVEDPLDDVSFVYFVRSLSLEPGQCYELRRYFRPEGNPVVIHVQRRETVTVPAGTFNAILVRPEITTSAIFSNNGRAELWLSDDSLHVPLKLQTSLSFGSINLYLSKVERSASP